MSNGAKLDGFALSDLDLATMLIKRLRGTL